MKKEKLLFAWKPRKQGKLSLKLRSCAKQGCGITSPIGYAAFHAVSALLISNGHIVGTHQGAVIMLHQHYIKTGVLEKKYGTLYSRLQTMREQSDYNCTYNATEEEIIPLIPLTEEFIEKILEMIK